uniref:Threonylcarbamoyl-AMP synthase n=1 Tax=Salix viminalis TaxID=40686 RepID=A0A6N2MAS5_SALVM
MAETKLYGHKLIPSLSSLPSSTTLRRHVAPFPSLVSFNTPKPPRLRVLSMAIKRSPKRLKYSAPRFTKEGGMLYVEVDELGADTWKLEPVIELLKQGAVGVIPTDTVYAIVCDLKSNSAIERLRRIKNIEPSKARNMAFLHSPLQSALIEALDWTLTDTYIDTYTTGFPSGDGQGHADIFRAVKHCLPGPYTFILTASKELPKQCVQYGTKTAKYASRKKVGVRMPDDAICQAILEKINAPLISTSVRSPKENEWMVDPVVIADIYGPEGLDFIVDGGVRVADPSTVVDMTGSYPKITRLGKGPKLHWMVAEDDDESAFYVEDVMPSATS